MNLAEAQRVAEQLSTSFAEVFINGASDRPKVLARGHNRAWSPQRVLYTRLGGKATAVLTNPGTRSTKL